MMKKTILSLTCFAAAAFLSAVSATRAYAQYTLDWVKEFNSISSEVFGTGHDAAGNYYVALKYYDTLDVDLGPGVTNVAPSNYTSIVVAKYTGSGSLVWAKNLTATDVNFIGDFMKVDPDGNIYLTGRTGMEPWVSADFDPGPGTAILNQGSTIFRFQWVLKWDSNGDFQWVKDIRADNSSYGVLARSIDFDEEGNVFVTGSWSEEINFGEPGNVTFSPGGVFLAKYNSSGVFQWAKPFNTSPTGYAYPSVNASSSGIYLSGYYSGSFDFNPGAGIDTLPIPNQYGGFLAKYNTSGDFQWVKGLNSPISCFINTAADDASGNIYVGGYYFGTVDFDPGPGEVNLTASGLYDAFIAKYNSSGNLVWARSTASQNSATDASYVVSLAIDYNGRIIAVGSSAGSVDYDPGAGTDIQTGPGAGNEAMVWMFNPSGEYYAAYVWGGGATDYAVFVTADPFNNVVISGVNGSPDMDYDVFSRGGSGGLTFLMKLNPPSFASISEEEEMAIALYPNPAGEQFTLTGLASGAYITISDMAGNTVYAHTAVSEKETIRTQNFAAGMYLVQASVNGNVYRTKLIVSK